jgi:hypothetical protein
MLLPRGLLNMLLLRRALPLLMARLVRCVFRVIILAPRFFLRSALWLLLTFVWPLLASGLTLLPVSILPILLLSVLGLALWFNSLLLCWRWLLLVLALPLFLAMLSFGSGLILPVLLLTVLLFVLALFGGRLGIGLGVR